MSKSSIIKLVLQVIIAAATAALTALGLSSCSFVRTVSNKSEFYQRGDTTVSIHTKTTESYDAKKQLPLQ